MVLLGLGAHSPGSYWARIQFYTTGQSSRYIKHTMIKPYLLAGLQLIKSMNSFIDLQHWQALQATLTLLKDYYLTCKPNTQRNSELASPVCQQDIYKASHMRIKFTVVPNYYAIKLPHSYLYISDQLMYSTLASGTKKVLTIL